MELWSVRRITAVAGSFDPTPLYLLSSVLMLSKIVTPLLSFLWVYQPWPCLMLSYFSLTFFCTHYYLLIRLTY